jgi:hypothetical protein
MVTERLAERLIRAVQTWGSAARVPPESVPVTISSAI